MFVNELLNSFKFSLLEIENNKTIKIVINGIGISIIAEMF